MIKKIVFTLALIMAAQLSFGQNNMDQLFSSYAKQKNVTHVKLGSMIMACASMFTETMGVKSVEVLSFERCDEETKKELNQAIRNLKDPAFDTMVSANEEGQRTKVLVKMHKQTIRELVVLTTGNNDAALVRIKGKIKPSDIEKITKQHGNG
ncbi:MAG: DUF4252 domain-containing protein [Tannerellaceae bacterium]|nr:DUF4252 domain-containing protein [Tannerellaceae bacterium]